MRLLFIKDFQNTPDQVIYKGEINTMWTETAKRAIKEGRAVEVPEGVDEALFAKNTFDNLKNKK